MARVPNKMAPHEKRDHASHWKLSLVHCQENPNELEKKKVNSTTLKIKPAGLLVKYMLLSSGNQQI
jgi:hypothetical protein